MPEYEVHYFTESEWVVIVDADSMSEAAERWRDPAYHTSEPECVNEEIVDGDAYIEEIA